MPAKAPLHARETRIRCENTHLVTKFVITTLELGIRDPDRKALALGKHPAIDVLPQVVTKAVCTCA